MRQVRLLDLILLTLDKGWASSYRVNHSSPLPLHKLISSQYWAINLNTSDVPRNAWGCDCLGWGRSPHLSPESTLSSCQLPTSLSWDSYWVFLLPYSASVQKVTSRKTRSSIRLFLYICRMCPLATAGEVTRFTHFWALVSCPLKAVIASGLKVQKLSTHLLQLHGAHVVFSSQAPIRSQGTSLSTSGSPSIYLELTQFPFGPLSSPSGLSQWYRQYLNARLLPLAPLPCTFIF